MLAKKTMDTFPIQNNWLYFANLERSVKKSKNPEQVFMQVHLKNKGTSDSTISTLKTNDSKIIINVHPPVPSILSKSIRMNKEKSVRAG